VASPMARAAADVFVGAWVERRRIPASAFPGAPESLREVYDVHQAIQEHPLVASILGGHAGYKLGAVGALGETCIYAPLFGSYLLPAPGASLSAEAIQMWQIEPEVGLVIGADLPPRTEGVYDLAAVWAAVSEVALCIECCGKRGTPDAYAASTKLGEYADTLSSGGVVIGARHSTAGLTIESVRSCATQLFVNDVCVAKGSATKTPDGGPIEALVWLANHLSGRGLGLKAGDFIATGQTCNTKAFKAGDRVKATFDGLGSVDTAVEMVISP